MWLVDEIVVWPCWSRLVDCHNLKYASSELEKSEFRTNDMEITGHIIVSSRLNPDSI